MSITTSIYYKGYENSQKFIEVNQQLLKKCDEPYLDLLLKQPIKHVFDHFLSVQAHNQNQLKLNPHPKSIQLLNKNIDAGSSFHLVCEGLQFFKRTLGVCDGFLNEKLVYTLDEEELGKWKESLVESKSVLQLSKKDNPKLFKEIIKQINLTTNKNNVAPEKGNVTNEKGNVTIEKENVTIGQENVTIGQENVTTEKENVTTEQKDVKIEKEGVKTEQKDVTPEKGNVTIGQENVTIGQENQDSTIYSKIITPLNVTLFVALQAVGTFYGYCIYKIDSIAKRLKNELPKEDPAIPATTDTGQEIQGTSQ